MRLVTLKHNTTISTYPIHQILYVRWFQPFNHGVVRFQGDLTLYELTDKEYDNLMAFITHSRDNHLELWRIVNTDV